jgi:hypothetical protein
LNARNITILFVLLAVLGGAFYYVSRPKPAAPVQPKEYVWSIEQDTIQRVTLSLPQENPPLSQSFIMVREGDKFPWHFDDANKSPVDSQRWGGGIPLLLSGPGADRVISENTTAEKLALFGFSNPKMVISLELNDGHKMEIDVGDRTPDGSNYYVKAPGTTAVATVDYTWYDVLSKLVINPPYAPPPTTKAK